jgi:hypothetical protein
MTVEDFPPPLPLDLPPDAHDTVVLFGIDVPVVALVIIVGAILLLAATLIVPAVRTWRKDAADLRAWWEKRRG